MLLFPLKISLKKINLFLDRYSSFSRERTIQLFVCLTVLNPKKSQKQRQFINSQKKLSPFASLFDPLYGGRQFGFFRF